MANYFSKNLKYLMAMQEKDANNVANHLGISVQSVYRYISGDSFPTIENLILLSQLFDISIDDLIKNDLRDGMTLKPRPEAEQVEGVQRLIEAFETVLRELKEPKPKAPIR